MPQALAALFSRRVADWFAQLNNKMGGDLKKIQTVGRYMVEIWKAVGMDMEKVEFLHASGMRGGGVFQLGPGALTFFSLLAPGITLLNENPPPTYNRGDQQAPRRVLDPGHGHCPQEQHQAHHPLLSDHGSQRDR